MLGAVTYRMCYRQRAPNLLKNKGCASASNQMLAGILADLKFSDIARSAGFMPMDNARYQTFLIDLEPELETLRKRLAGKWRTDLNRGAA